MEVAVVEPTIIPLSVRPFLKWVGGKGQIIEKISENLPPPSSYKRYFEPFLGGGAVFFRLIPRDKEAFLSDINSDLIAAYFNIQNSVSEVIEEYVNIADAFIARSKRGRKKRYIDLRKNYNSLSRTENSIKKTALLIFLNRTCFNGVYRENSKGEFNVPYGRPNLKTLRNTGHILEVSEKLKGKSILNSGFEEVLTKAKKGDLVYLDPPYVPLTATANFTKYHSTDFSLEQHALLANLFKELDRRGCYVIMSNSHTDLVKNLYEEFWSNTRVIDANRTINCKGDLRLPVKEVLIKNY